MIFQKRESLLWSHEPSALRWTSSLSSRSGHRKRSRRSGRTILGRIQAAAAEPVTKRLPGPRKPSLDGSDRPLQLPGGLLVGLPFQAAKNQRQPVSVGQLADLFAKQRYDRRVRRLRGMLGPRTRAGHFPSSALGGLGSSSPGDSQGNAMKPGCNGVQALDRVRASGEDQEDVLKGVLSVMRFVENAAAYGEDHRAVSLDELAECFRVLLDHKPFQQVSFVHLTTLSLVPKGPVLRRERRDAAGHRRLVHSQAMDENRGRFRHGFGPGAGGQPERGQPWGRLRAVNVEQVRCVDRVEKRSRPDASPACSVKVNREPAIGLSDCHGLAAAALTGLAARTFEPRVR